jgi:glycosyltransferase involved in cell wall biosynthesis
MLNMLSMEDLSERSPDPLVTIVIPYHHNYAEYLGACLESIRQQTYRNWEAILVDDASVGETAQAVVGKLADARFRIIRHERNRGQAAARNTGIRNGSGTFVMPVDCDDLLAPTHLEKLMRALDAHRHCGAAYADFNLFFAATGVLEFPVRDTRALLRDQWIPHPGTVVRRVLWERANGYCEDEIFRAGNEDWDYFLAIAEIDLQAVRVPEPLYQYRQHKRSITTSRFAYSDYVSREVMYLRHQTLFDRYGMKGVFLAGGYRVSGVAFWRKGEYARALRLLARACWLSPLGFVGVLAKKLRRPRADRQVRWVST